MVARTAGAVLLVMLFAGLAVAQSSESPLVVKLTTEHRVYRGGRFVHITLTETNTSDRPAQIVTGCRILHGRITAQDGSTVAVFRDQRMCATVSGKLSAGAKRTLAFGWDGRVYWGGDLAAPTLAPPGRYTITAGVDGVEGSTVVWLRRRRR